MKEDQANKIIKADQGKAVDTTSMDNDTDRVAFEKLVPKNVNARHPIFKDYKDDYLYSLYKKDPVAFKATTSKLAKPEGLYISKEAAIDLGLAEWVDIYKENPETFDKLISNDVSLIIKQTSVKEGVTYHQDVMEVIDIYKANPDGFQKLTSKLASPEGLKLLEKGMELSALQGVYNLMDIDAHKDQSKSTNKTAQQFIDASKFGSSLLGIIEDSTLNSEEKYRRAVNLAVDSLSPLANDDAQRTKLSKGASQFVRQCLHEAEVQGLANDLLPLGQRILRVINEFLETIGLTSKVSDVSKINEAVQDRDSSKPQTFVEKLAQNREMQQKTEQQR